MKEPAYGFIGNHSVLQFCSVCGCIVERSKLTEHTSFHESLIRLLDPEENE